ncbi:Lipoprotein LpqB precursor [Corynebacterium bovis DSM 20582 = CIP 54.80]|nr:Lipoprotein LpqB precursor [Corynebacterium bovis DSM 20582 = CIP 54.80]
MNRRMGDRPGRAVRRLLAAVGTVPLVAACTTLPGESAPEVVSSYVSQPTQENVVEPRPGQPSDLLLRDFFSASAHPIGNHQAAKKFLDDGVADRWQDGAATIILDHIDINSDGAARDGRISYKVRGNIIGRLGTGGTFRPENTPYEETYELSRADDEWRIDGLPNGVVMDRNDFTAAYQDRDIYFLDPTQRRLVPDRRWVYTRQESQASSLMSLLAAGPRDVLTRGVHSALPPDAAVQASSSGGPGFTVDFSGLSTLSAEDRTRLAAQVVWTLASADIRGPYTILADGSPLSDEVDGGWNIDDVSQFDPKAAPVTPLRALRDGGLVEVTDGQVRQMQGWPARGGIESVGVSAASSAVAGVVSRGDRRRALLVGTPDEEPRTAAEGESLTRPTWTADGTTFYSVVDGQKVMRFTRSSSSGEISRQEVDRAGLDELGDPEARISVFQVSRDGTRAVVLVNGRVYISVLERGDGDRVRLGRFIQVGYQLGETAVSAEWQVDGSLIVGTRANDAPVWRVEVDGSSATQLPSRNVTAPVVAVASTSTLQYITDGRALLQLDPGDSDSRYWREVPALQGERAVPIIAQ